MRASGVAVLAAAFAAAGCASEPASRGSAATPSRTQLQIVAWPAGKSGRSRTWTLRCPAGGTLPRPARACSRLAALESPFAPVPGDVACTEIYGGPQVAEVRGTFKGRRVNARFSRTDGCQISRWERVKFLFPVRT